MVPKTWHFFNGPRSLLSPPRFVRVFSYLFFFFPGCPGLFFFRENSRVTVVPSPCAPVWSQTPRRCADLTVFPLCSRLYSPCESNNRTTELEAPSLWFMWFPPLMSLAGMTPWQSAHPEFDSLKKRGSRRCHPAFDPRRMWCSIRFFITDWWK